MLTAPRATPTRRSPCSSPIPGSRRSSPRTASSSRGRRDTRRGRAVSTADSSTPCAAGHRGALHAPGGCVRGGGRRAQRRRRHADRLGQDALLQPPGPRRGRQGRGGAGALPLPHQGAGRGPARGAARARRRGRHRPEEHTYDGDTPPNVRSVVRAAGQVVITNPDMLHAAILPHHTKWFKLFENLRYVVIDELHTYRGCSAATSRTSSAASTGSAPTTAPTRLHLRQRRRSRIPASSPSACSRPGRAHRRQRRAIGRRRPRRQPAGRERGARDPQLGAAHRAAHRRAAHRRRRADDRLRPLPNVGRGPDQLPARDVRAAPGHRTIRGYRGGYLPNERHEIEEGLRDGRVRGVVATNALELGIDIGGLDAALSIGYPGTIASTTAADGPRRSAHRRASRRSSAPPRRSTSSSPRTRYLFDASPSTGS